MATILIAPPGASDVHINGKIFRAATDGTITADDSLVPALLQIGCVRPQVQTPNVTTSGRPTTGTKAGDNLFDTTLGKPIWRNKTNNGWVDATGTAC